MNPKRLGFKTFQFFGHNENIVLSFIKEKCSEQNKILKSGFPFKFSLNPDNLFLEVNQPTISLRLIIYYKYS